MIKPAGKLKTYDGVVFCFIASVIIAVIAYNIGLITEPGKILPEGLSMRSGEMSGNIVRGIDIAVEDVELIRSGKAYADLWRLLTFVHLDLFFYLHASLCLNDGSDVTIGQRQQFHHLGIDARFIQVGLHGDLHLGITLGHHSDGKVFLLGLRDQHLARIAANQYG